MRAFVSYLVVLLFCFSCAEKEFPDYEEDREVQRETEQGNYRAEFNSLNQKWTSKVQGYSIMWLRGKQFYARVSVKTNMPGVMHMQYVHQGPHCPDKNADRSGDGVIDMKEVIAASGKILIPLDGDLSLQRPGAEGFPVADDEGEYIYFSASSIGKMMRDLRSSKRPDRYFTKLPNDKDLALHERIIVLYGIKDNVTFPIACAEIFEDYEPEE